MKKHFFVFILFSFFFSAFPQDTVGSAVVTEPEEDKYVFSTRVPQLLQGIWQGESRLIYFSGDETSFNCVLRVFYKWYDDRAAESEQYAQLTSRDNNDTTNRTALNMEIQYRTLGENKNKNSGAYEIAIRYPGQKEFTYFPVAIIGDKLYLNFFIRKNSIDPEANPGYFLIDTGVSSGITISPLAQKKELLSYYVNGNSLYHIRYWPSDMDLTSQQAEFSDGNSIFYVDKFILTANRLFTCTTGRSLKIRNMTKSSFDETAFTFDEDRIIYTTDEPYLIKVPGSNTKEGLLKAVELNNQRRHPPQKPPFPPSNINFHWKEISDLEKYNPYTWNRRNLDIHK